MWSQGNEKRPFKNDLTNSSTDIKKGKRQTERAADRTDLGRDFGDQDKEQ